MKLKISLLCAGICLLLTGCAEKQEETSSYKADTAPVVRQTEPSEAKPIAEVPDITPANPEDIVGIWQTEGGKGYTWFQEDSDYIVMQYLGTFQDDILMEQDGDTVVLKTIDEANQMILTPVGTHAFDTIDGMYDAEDKDFQVLIVGNQAYLYIDDETKYEFDGITVTLTDSLATYSVPCILEGDNLEFLYASSKSFSDYENMSATRTHDLDTLLLDSEQEEN